MADVCEKHNIKLLTYGTFVRIAFYASAHRLPAYLTSRLLQPPCPPDCVVPSGKCGGFLADAWLDRPEPDPYSGALTPSQRKVSLNATLVRFPPFAHHSVPGVSVSASNRSSSLHSLRGGGGMWQLNAKRN
jgi:hypothetical protein